MVYPDQAIMCSFVTSERGRVVSLDSPPCFGGQIIPLREPRTINRIGIDLNLRPRRIEQLAVVEGLRPFPKVSFARGMSQQS